ncbi:MAG: PRC-barrel domain-containing protein, partial [Abitibacteriaceae bacterium]|nr:PRC-barrel domain-containing protein [Abditibacteriaceae bacterium]
MIRARALRGLAVVDVGAAQKMGQIEEVFLTPDYHRVAGFLVSQGQSLLGKGTSVFLPAACVHAVGPDAMTISHSGISNDQTDSAESTTSSASLPRMSHLVGQKVVSENGRLLGSVEDALIDASNGRVLRYELAAPTSGSKLESLLGVNHAHQRDYVRADTDLRVGPDLIVVPDDALMTDDGTETAPGSPVGDASVTDASLVTTTMPSATSSGWADSNLSSSTAADAISPLAAPVPPVIHPTPPPIHPSIADVAPGPGGLTPSASPITTGNDLQTSAGVSPAWAGQSTSAQFTAASANLPPMVDQAPETNRAAQSNVQHGIDDDPHHDPEKGAALGGVGGLAVGATAGSMVGPIGTIVGAIVGGLAGALGSGAAVAAVDQVDNDNTLTGVSQWEQVAPHYRQGWEQHYGHTGAKWEQHEPIYRFAWERRHDPRYHQRSWAD